MKPALNQNVTYWAPVSENQFGGKVYSAPRIIKARWEQKVENVTSQTGQNITSRARIYTQDEVKPEGYVYLGETDVPDPTLVSEAWELRLVGSTPSISNLQRLYTAWV